MTYTLLLKRTKQRKYHFYEHLTIKSLPRLDEHILIDRIKYKIVDIVHQFHSEIKEKNLLETQQYGTIYAEQDVDAS